MSQNQLWMSFLKTSALSVLLLTVVVAIFNFLVNPYNLFCKVCAEPRQAESNHQRLYKMVDLLRYQPKHLLLGTSRVDYGIDGTRLTPQPYYNAGLSDASMTEIFSLLKAADRIAGLEKVVLFLDISSFDESDNQGAQDFRLSLGRDVGWRGLGEYYIAKTASAVLSLDAILASIEVLLTTDQHCIGTRYYGQAQAQDKACSASQSGRKEAFMEVAQRLAENKYGRAGIDHLQRGLAIFDSILEYCRTHNIDLQLVYPPVHDEVLNIARSLSLTPAFPQWKVSIDNHIANSSKKSWQSSLQSKDLTSIAGVTDEVVAEQMHYWWEASHFKPEVKFAL
ncbi:MAG: hypothetical protein ACI9W6_002111 [Motiliproteus sp.]|jgi:hypothetical protein